MNKAFAYRPEPGFSCRWLNCVDVIDCDELQDNVINNLTEEELRLYFYPRNSVFRDYAIMNKNYIAGCFYDQQLVGQAILLKNDNERDLKTNFMLDIDIPENISTGCSAVITNAMVDPAYRGRNSMFSTLMFVNGQLPSIGIDTSYFITHVTNHPMISAGVRAGYEITNVGTCCNNNEPMYLMTYSPAKKAQQISGAEYARAHADSIQEAKRHFEQGFTVDDYVDSDRLLLQRAKAV